VHFNLTDLAADITQNGAESGAKLLRLEVRETVSSGNAAESAAKSRAKSEFRFIVTDNGKGMSGAGLERAMDPFVTDGVKHPGRKVGLGLPFLIQTAVQSGGGWKITSATAGGERTVRSGGGGDFAANADTAASAGTIVEAWFDLDNMDTPPVGDIPGLFRSVLLFSGPEEIVLKRNRKGGGAELDYEVKKTELTEALGGDLEDVSSLVLLGKYLRSLEGFEEEG
jgi:hypothetical protein